MLQKSASCFLIAAPKSNSGKTLVTLGMIQAFINRGKIVQPFKCGPDYIDTLHHSNIAQLPSINLDCWMASQPHIAELFNTKANKCEVAIVEGAMGLFDGADKDFGSSAHIARLLQLPIILVCDATAMAFGAAPILWGLKNFDPSIHITGVIFNKVSGTSQQYFLHQAADAANIKVLGFLPKDERLTLASRHLGLTLPHETHMNQVVGLMANYLEDFVDLDAILEMNKPTLPIINRPNKHDKRIKIAVARDEAFCFFYQANLDRLAELGDIYFFSPLHDNLLPECQLLWIPGGYPELHLDQLGKNQSMMEQIRYHAQQKRSIVAECGGMMYLGNSIKDKQGATFAMTNILNYSTSLQNMKLHLGYREIQCGNTSFRGHEFHYSQIIDQDETPAPFTATNARGLKMHMPVFCRDGIWASYLHLYLGERERMHQFLKQLNAL